MVEIKDILNFKQELKKLVEQGSSLEELMKVLKAPREDLLILLKELNIFAPQKNKAPDLYENILNKRTMGKAIRYLRNGFSLQEVARKIGIKQLYLSKELKRQYNLSVPAIKRKILFNFDGYSRDKMIKLFKKYGSIPKVSRATGIEGKYIRRFLMSEFGVGINGIKKILKVNKYNKCRLSKKQLQKLRDVEEVYNRCGTLEAAGVELGLTRERVRQLLRDGRRYGVTHYQDARKRDKNRFEELRNILPQKLLFQELIKSTDHAVIIAVQIS